MLISITRSGSLIFGLLFISVVVQAQVVVCYISGAQDSNFVYGTGCASIPYGSSAHISNMKMTITSNFGRSSQTWTSGSILNSSMSLLDASGVEEDGNYSFYLQVEGECYYNSSTHVMAAAYTTVFDQPKIIMTELVGPNSIPYSADGNFSTNISCSKSLINTVVNFHAIYSDYTCSGGTYNCPPKFSLAPAVGADVAVTLSATAQTKTWNLDNENSNNGSSADATIQIYTEYNANQTVVVNNGTSKKINLH